MTAEQAIKAIADSRTWTIALADRGIQAVLVLVAVAAAGLIGLGLAWSGVAATLDAQFQMPYLISGAIGGIAVAGTALAILGTHLERRRSAGDRADTETLIRVAAEIADTLPAALQEREA